MVQPSNSRQVIDRWTWSLSRHDIEKQGQKVMVNQFQPIMPRSPPHHHVFTPCRHGRIPFFAADLEAWRSADRSSRAISLNAHFRSPGS